MTRRPSGAMLLLLAGAAAAFAAFVAATGGIDTRIAGIAVRSRSWERPATVAVVLALAGLYSVRRTLRSWGPLASRSVAPVLVAWAMFAALWFGTYAAGGADSFGYLSQAQLFAQGRLTDMMPRHEGFDWPDVPATLTPLAYTRNAVPDALVPVYPPGLSLMMAPLTLIHANAAFLLVPLCAALTVWLTVVLGRAISEPAAGVLGALLVVVSPTFLLQSAQPMSDVPVAALWLSALVLARRPSTAAAILAGVVSSLAILVRPNLAPLLLLVAAACATLRPAPSDRPAGASSLAQLPWTRAICPLLAAMPGVVALGAIQAVRYGSPLGSGYGSFDDLFALSNIAPNLARYPRWMTETHTPLIWLWLLAPLSIRFLDRGVRAFGWILYIFAAAVVLAYLPYVYFRPEEWSYTRFLLPALPLMAILVALVLLTAARRFVPRAPVAAAAAVCVVVAALSVYNDVSLGVFGMRDGERKYPRAGGFVSQRLPATAFVLAAQHSGSIRYYSGRPTLRWDMLDAGSLDRAIASLRRAGYEPYAVLDVEEDERFRAYFGARDQQAVEGLIPMATLGNTNVYGFR
jgi:Oligosaccharyl transferase STT3, N-terminal